MLQKLQKYFKKITRSKLSDKYSSYSELAKLFRENKDFDSLGTMNMVRSASYQAIICTNDEYNLGMTTYKSYRLIVEGHDYMNNEYGGVDYMQTSSRHCTETKVTARNMECFSYFTRYNIAMILTLLFLIVQEQEGNPYFEEIANDCKSIYTQIKSALE